MFQRGISYDPVFDFRVSKTQFASIAPDASAEFSAFSGAAAFARVGEQPQLWPISFQVAGSTQEAAVRGFGTVVNDGEVQEICSNTILQRNPLIGVVHLPARTADNPFSFTGITFREPVITSIRVKFQGLLAAGGKRYLTKRHNRPCSNRRFYIRRPSRQLTIMVER